MPTKTYKDQGKTDTGETPPFTAARKGHVEVVTFLVESGANKRPRHDSMTDDFGVTSLLSQLKRGTLRLSNFWLGPAPSMTKAAMAF